MPELLSLFVCSLARAAAPAGEAWLPLSAGGPDWDRVAGVSTTAERRERAGRPEVRALLSPEAAARLAAQGVPLSGYRADHRRGAPGEGYHPPEAVNASLSGAVARSERAGLVQVGSSAQGRPILAAWFGVGPGLGAPSLRLLGGHHGDEPIAVEVALALADRLADLDGLDERVTSALDRGTVWVVLAVNPDGLAQGSRTNARDVDLNRNYDYAWDAGTSRAGPRPFSEPETRAVRHLALLERPVLSLSLHAGASNLGWPWNFQRDPPEDRALLERLAEDYARDCLAPGFWITQGADWYVTYGDTNDWAYGRYGTLDFTLEVDLDKAPAADQIEEVISWHEEAILQMLALPPLSGRVVDAESGAPVSGVVWSDEPGAPVWTDPLTGRFHRLALPEQPAQRVFAEAYGYAPGELALVPGEEPVIELVRTTLQRPDDLPRLLPPGAELRAEDSAMVLWQPGSAELSLSPGQSVETGELAPGPWSVALGDGRVWANAILVEGPEQVELWGWSAEGELRGRGFGVGTRAVGYWGETRHPVELPVLSVRPELVLLDTSALPEGEPVDVLLFSAGGVLALPDWHHPPPLDPGAGVEPDEPSGGCACGSTTGHLLGPVWSNLGQGAPLLLLLIRRRSR